MASEARCRVTPRRIQLSRKKGWRMPENTVKVDRTSKWGNPFRVTKEHPPIWASFMHHISVNGRMVPGSADERQQLEFRQAVKRELKGKNLACWCHLCEKHKNGKPLGVGCQDCGICHADTLLNLANEPLTRRDTRKGRAMPMHAKMPRPI